MCSALNSDRSIDELAIKLGEIKTQLDMKGLILIVIEK